MPPGQDTFVAMDGDKPDDVNASCYNTLDERLSLVASR
jgi:hypothetical protein